MFQNRLAFPLTAAALAVLLAACGSDSGSPDSGGVTPKDAAAAQPPAAATVVSTEKAPADQGPLIDATGVRGDLLLSMMDHRICHHNYLRPAASHDGARVVDVDGADLNILARYGLGTTNYQPVPGAPTPVGMPGHDIPCSPSLYTYAPFTDGTKTLVQNTYVPQNRTAPDRNSQRRFPRAETTTDITVSGSAVTLSTEMNVSLSDGNQTLISANAFTFNTGDRVPYGLLSLWGQGDTFTELMLLPASNANQAKLCWNVHVSNVRRLHCSLWDVPEGWQRGNGTLNLQDQYVIDDRVVHAGESGHLYWRGNF